jgi:hypothetical protein
VRISDELARLTASLLAENIVTETMKWREGGLV